MSKTIVFFGTDEFSAYSLRALINAGFPIGLIITQPDRPSGRGRKIIEPVTKTIGKQNGIKVLQPAKLSDIISDIAALNNPVGVLVSFGRIIPQSIIDLFSPGIVNVHPSLLPIYRGPSPIESTILNGDKETGVSIMQLSAAMDAGPVYDQTRLRLTGGETTPQLEETLGESGANRLVDILPSIVDGSLQPIPQNDELATYCQLTKKEDSLLDTENITAAEAERRVRAYLAFPKTKLTVLEQLIIVTKAHVEEESINELSIKFKDGKFLQIDELISPNGRRIEAKAFLNGYKK